MRDRKSEAVQMRPCIPATSAPSAAGRQSGELQKGLACPKARPNRSRHRFAAPPSARRATAPERIQAPFSLDRARPVSLLARPIRGPAAPRTVGRGGAPKPTEWVRKCPWGARERAQFSPHTETRLSGLCDDMGVHPAGQALPGRGQHPPAAGAAHSRAANAYGSSRHSGMDMHRGPPRPRESSALGMVWSRMPASSRARLVT